MSFFDSALNSAYIDAIEEICELLANSSDCLNREVFSLAIKLSKEEKYTHFTYKGNKIAFGEENDPISRALEKLTHKFDYYKLSKEERSKIDEEEYMYSVEWQEEQDYNECHG